MNGKGANVVTNKLKKAAKLQKATLHDVAAMVGVSPRTVSRVVNEEGGFSEETRDRVLEAIQELNYRPNLLARSLITNRSNTLGFVITMIDDPFFSELAHGVQLAARQMGFTMFLGVTDARVDVQSELLDQMVSRGIDGAILFPAVDSLSSLAEVADRGLPMVIIDDEIDHPSICCVSSDLRDGARQAAAHLLATGRRNLAMLGSDHSPERRKWRVNGFLDKAPDGRLCAAPATMDGGHQAMKELLAQDPTVDGVFAYNDLMAIGAIAAIKESGRSVPDDVAVVGCDDIQMSQQISPSLTTVQIDRERLGSEAVNRLAQLRDGKHPDSLTIPVKLIVREST